MKILKWLFVLAVIALMSKAGHAQGSLAGVNGDCTIGGQQALTQGLPSTATQQIGTSNVLPGAGVQASFPNCQVTVYLSGTLAKEAIYANNLATPTPLSNPFTANVDGSWTFFVPPGACYDIVMSTGTGPTLPYSRSLTDVCVGIGSGGGGANPAGAVTQVQYNGGGGQFGASPAFTYVAGTGQLTITDYTGLGLQVGGLSGSLSPGSTGISIFASDTSAGTNAFKISSPTGNAIFSIADSGRVSILGPDALPTTTALSIVNSSAATMFSVSDSGVMLGNIFDMAGVSSAPSNPAAGFCREYFNTTSGTVAWVNSSGLSCGPGGGGGGLSGSGTPGFLTEWTGIATLGNGPLVDTPNSGSGYGTLADTSAPSPYFLETGFGQFGYPASSTVSGPHGGAALFVNNLSRTATTAFCGTVGCKAEWIGNNYNFSTNPTIELTGLLVNTVPSGTMTATTIPALSAVRANTSNPGGGVTNVTNMYGIVASVGCNSTDIPVNAGPSCSPGSSTPETIGTQFAGVFLGTASANSIGLSGAIYAQVGFANGSSSFPTTTASSAAVYIDSPQFGSFGVSSTLYGIYIGDQSAFGSGISNLNNYTIYEAPGPGGKNVFVTTTFTGNVTLNITGASAQCLQVSPTGVVSGTGAGCGSGGGATFPPGTGIPQVIGGASWGATYGVSGSGNVALTNSPTFITPNLGTPSVLVLTNATGAPTWNQNTTGTAANLAGCTTPTAGTIIYGTGSGWACFPGNTSGTASFQENASGVPSWGAGSSTTFQVNTSVLSSSSTVNFLNSAATNGLTLTFTNTSAGNIQLGYTGTLNNSGLTNPSATINGQTLTLGSTATIPEQVNSVTLTSTAGFNVINSTTNVAGFNVVISNPATNQIKAEVTNPSGQYPGNAAGLYGTPSITVNTVTATQINGATLAGSFTGSATFTGNLTFTGTDTFTTLVISGLSGTSPLCANGAGGAVTNVGCAGGGSGPGTGTQNAVAYWNTTTTLGSIASSVAGQSLVFQASGPPVASSPSLADSTTSPITTTPYTIQCDSSTTIIDRAHTVRLAPGSSVITVPLSTATGCGNLVTTIMNDNAGTVTFNASGSDTISVFAGSSTNSGDAQTSFTLGSWQYLTLNQAATGIWEARIYNSVVSVTAGAGLSGGGTGGAVTLSIPAAGVTNAMLAGSITLANLANQNANTVLGNFSGSTGAVTANAVASCSGNNQGLQWLSNTGITCNSSMAMLNVAETFTALQTFGTNISIGGVTVSGVTGTGNLVFATTPTITSATLAGASTVVPSGATVTIQSGGTLTCAAGSTCPTGSGTVTVVGGGVTASTELVTGGGSQTVQTPCSGCTLNAGGAMVLSGSISVPIATLSGAGAASTPGLNMTGAAYTAGTATTNTPQLFLNSTGNAVTTWSNNGTQFGIAPVSGFTGNLLDFHYQNGGNSVLTVNYQGLTEITPVASVGGTANYLSVIGHAGEASTGAIVNFDTTAGAGGAEPNTFRVGSDGFSQMQVCTFGTGGAAFGANVFGSALTCAAMATSPARKNVFSTGTNGHILITGVQLATAATGDMVQLNNATAAGTAYNFLTAYSGVTGVDGSHSGGTLSFVVNGQGAVTATSYTSNGGSAGFLQLGQGTTNGAGTTDITIQAPTSVTSYVLTLPGTAGTGLDLWTNSAGVVTESLLASAAAGDIVVGTGTTWSKLAGNASGINCLQENASGVASWGACGGGGVTSVNTLTGAVVIEAATAGQMAVSGGAGAALTGAADMTYTTHTFATTTAGIFDWSAATGTAAFKVPQTTTNTASAAGVLDFDTTNKNYHGYVNGSDSIFLNISAAPTNNDVLYAAVASGNTLVADAGFLYTNIVRKDATNAGAAAMTLNMSASTTAPSLQFPAVVGGSILAGTSTANLSAPFVIQNTNSTNNNTSITLGIASPGTSTGQTTLNINGATTGGDLTDWGTGGTWTAGVLSGQTIVAKVGITGAITAPSFTASGTIAGNLVLGQGSTAGTGTTNITWQAPTSVTSYLVTLPGTAAQGIMIGTLSGTTITDGFTGDSNHSATVTTGSGTSIGLTSLCSTTFCPAGTYEVNFYTDITTACGTSGTYTVLLTWTDDQGSKSAFTVPIAGTGTAVGVLTTTSTANWGQATMTIRSTGAAAIQYSTTAVACGTAGPMVGKLYMSVTPKQ